MSVEVGTRLGSLEITALLGKGGMGEVYRARDTKLKRDVAIKILPDEFSCDADRVSRFQREAEVLASLNHPNIAAIYDLQEVNGSRFLVLELVEGETLAERIARGPIPADEALTMAKQIVEALEAAHERGIIHRDLKPANVKITPDGKVKVLDFGLSKIHEPERVGANLSDSPTMMTAASIPGIVLGTAAYMPPEQAKGKQADRTADVWAFGCVLYEMLTGRCVFQGETLGEILAGVLKDEPDWNRLPPDTPEGIRRLLRRCLKKDRKHRLSHIDAARIEIDEVQTEPRRDSPPMPTATRRGERLAWLSALVAVITIAAVMIFWGFHSVQSVPELRLEITTPPTSDPGSFLSFAISPDGMKIVYVAASQGRWQLWLRSLDSVSARPLAGTEGSSYPFWSPDSRSIGFFAENRLKRIDIDGGSVQILANSVASLGGAWNRDGIILFNPNRLGPIFRIRASGGERPVAVTRLDSQGQADFFPQFLPDGRHFLYFHDGARARGINISQLDGPDTQHLLDADAPAAVTSSGQLLFVRQGTLFAQSFNSVRLALTGSPVPVAENVATVGDYIAAFSVSAVGPIAYRTGSAGQRQFVWFDRSGNELAKVGEPDPGFSANPSLSPNGHQVALNRTGKEGVRGLWLLETTRGVLRLFASSEALHVYPVWSPDGTRIVFSSNPKGGLDLYEKSITNNETEELLLSTPELKRATDWSRDGRFLVYNSVDPNLSSVDIWALSMDGDRKRFPVLKTNFDERDAQFTPDGKWIAYQSNESGRFEIYVQSFPGPGSKERVSTGGGTQVRWSPDGKELFYIAPDGRLMEVPMRFTSSGQAIEVSAPVPLFATHIGSDQGVNGPAYMVSPDGRRFLMNNILTEETTSAITVILNWKPKL